MQFLKENYFRLKEDGLYKNSLFLMMSTLIMSGCGFLFWFINAKLFTPEDVGLATGIISLANLISSLSLLGIGNVLIRYLPKSNQKNEKLSTSFILVAGTTIILYMLYILGKDFLTPKLAEIQSSPLIIILIAIFLVFTSWNILFDSIFIAYRASLYVLIKNTLISVLKIVFPVFLLLYGGFGIFTAGSLAIVISVVVSIFFLIKKFAFTFIPKVNVQIIRSVAKYSFGNYLLNSLVMLPGYILPIYVLDKIGSEDSAYYYVSYMIANLLFTISFAVSSSLVAESAHDGKNTKVYFTKSIKGIALVLIPGILITMFLGKYILLAFGSGYSTGGLMLLRLLTISSIFVSINSLYVSYFRIEERTKELIIYSIVLAFSTIGLSVLFTPYGITGMGIAFLISTMLTSIVSAAMAHLMPRV